MIAVVNARYFEAITILEIINAGVNRSNVVIRSRGCLCASDGDKISKDFDSGDHTRIRTRFSRVDGIRPRIPSALIRRCPGDRHLQRRAVVGQRYFDWRLVMTMQADSGCFFVAPSDGLGEGSMAFMKIQKG